MRINNNKIRQKTIMKFIYNLFCLFLILTLSSCSYVSTSPYLKHIKSITIPRVTIEDPELGYEYEDVITEQLRDTFSSKWREGDDSILTVTVKDYKIVPIAFDATNNPEQLRMSLVVDYTFEDRVKNKIIDRRTDYTYNYDFYTVEGKGEPPETIPTATKRMIEGFCRDLFGNLAEQW